MAKLKIKSGIQANIEIPVENEMPKVEHSDIEKMQQSIGSVANGVSQFKYKMNQHKTETTNLVNKVTSNLRKELKTDMQVNLKELNALSRQVEDLKDSIKAHNPELQEKEVRIETQRIIEPKVEQIVHHKDHNDDIHMLSDRITSLNKEFKINRDEMSKEIKKQKNMNKILLIALTITTLLHLL